MSPEIRLMPEEDGQEDEFVGLNVDSNLLEIVPKLFKTEPEVEVFYDGLLQTIESDKRLRKNKDRQRLNKAFIDELLKYHTVDEINNVLNGIDNVEEAVSDEEAKIDKILRRTFKSKVEFRMFITHITQFMMEDKLSPVEAAAKAMKIMGKSDSDILSITAIIDKIL